MRDLFEKREVETLQKYLVAWSKQLMLVLMYLDMKEIAHNNLKPENILIQENMSILVTGIGEAQLNKKFDLFEARSQGQSNYIAPERALGDAGSIASDMWYETSCRNRRLF